MLLRVDLLGSPSCVDLFGYLSLAYIAKEHLWSGTVDARETSGVPIGQVQRT